MSLLIVPLLYSDFAELLNFSDPISEELPVCQPPGKRADEVQGEHATPIVSQGFCVQPCLHEDQHPRQVQPKKSRVLPDEPAEILKSITHKSLTKGEIKGVNARIEEFNLEGSVHD